MDDDDHDNLALRNSIKQSISRQKYEAFASLTYAAKSGDLEIVRDILRRGVDINQADYDGRTAFAMVSTTDTIISKFLCHFCVLCVWIFRHVLRGVIRLWNTFWKRGLIRTHRIDGRKRLLMKQLRKGKFRCT